MLQKIEEAELNKIITNRAQFGEKRYQFKIESLLFQNKEQIQQTVDFLTNYVINAQQNISNIEYYLQNVFKGNFRQINKNYQMFIKSDQIFGNQSQSNDLYDKLKNLFIKHINYQNQVEQKKYQQIILELNPQEQHIFIQKQNEISREEYIKDLIFNRNDSNFDYNQRNLEQKYLLDYNKNLKLYQDKFKEGYILVMIYGKQYAKEEIIQYFNQTFYLDESNLVLKQQGTQNQKQYNPILQLNTYFKSDLIQKILYLNEVQLNEQLISNFRQSNLFPQCKTNLQLYFYITEVVEICSQIIKWNQIILKSVSELNFNNDSGDSNSKIIINCKKELNKMYDMQDQRFQDNFHQFQESLLKTMTQSNLKLQQTQDAYSLFENFKENDITISEDRKGLVIFQCNQNSIVLYQKVKISGQPYRLFGIIQLLNYQICQGELAQIALSDKEAGLNVLTIQFSLSNDTKQLVEKNKNNPQNLELIYNYLIKIAAIIMKRKVLNKISRDNISKLITEI